VVLVVVVLTGTSLISVFLKVFFKVAKMATIERRNCAIWLFGPFF
jgi:hypothetical protein